MTRIGGLPTARGLLRKCRARARPIANGSNRRTQFPFCQCAEASPRGFPKNPFRSYSQAARRAHGVSGCHGAHRAHGARARKAREIRETCHSRDLPMARRVAFVGRQGCRAGRWAARAPRAPRVPPALRPLRALRPLQSPRILQSCRIRKAPRRRQILISGRAPRRLN